MKRKMEWNKQARCMIFLFAFILLLAGVLIPARVSCAEELQVGTETLDLLQTGALLPQEEEADGEEALLTASMASYETIEKKIVTALKAQKLDCDLQSCNIPVSKIKSVMSEIINHNPRYFYVASGYKYYYNSKNMITFVEFSYTMDKATAQKCLAAYDDAVDLAVSGAKSNWSDFEKVLYINDYLCRNCTYDLDAANCYNAYGVLVEKRAVCQGYALAFMELAKQLNVECEFVSSLSLNHAWNIVKVNGSYYYIDVTWNDPTWDSYGCDWTGMAAHNYFLKSVTYFRSEDDMHSTHLKLNDWVLTGGLSYTSAANTQYDSAFWDDIIMGFSYVNGSWYGCVQGDTYTANINRYTCDGKTLKYAEQVIASMDKWYNRTYKDYYKYNYCGLGSFDGTLYYSNSTSIMSYNTVTKKTATYYTLSSGEQEKGYLYGIHVDSCGLLNYMISAAPGNELLDASRATKQISYAVVDYPVTYYLNGGQNAAANPASYRRFQSVVLSGPTKTGYTFAGWYSDAALKNKVTRIRKGYTGAVTLYAKWTPIQYNIKFNGNGATSGKVSKLSQCTYDGTYRLPANTFKKKYYTFKGWNTKKNGTGKSFKNKAGIRNLTTTNGKTITLYAQWTRTKYKVTYKLNGGKNNKKNPAYVYHNSKTVVLKKPTRKGYTFVGWYTDKNCTKQITKIRKGTSKKITFYAKWRKG